MVSEESKGNGVPKSDEQPVTSELKIVSEQPEANKQAMVDEQPEANEQTKAYERSLAAYPTDAAGSGLITAPSAHGFSQEHKLLFLCCMLLGIAFVYLFYGKPAGVSHPLFIGLMYALFIRFNRRSLSLQANHMAPLMLAPILLLSCTYVFFANELFALLNMLAIPLLIALQTTWWTDRSSPKFRTALMLRSLEHLLPQSLRQVPVPFRMAAAMLGDGKKNGRATAIWKVLLGLFIALPILMVVLTLLSSADTMFARSINEIPALLNSLNLWGVFGRLFWVVLVGGYIFCYIWGLQHPFQGGITRVGPDARQRDYTGSTESSRSTESLGFPGNLGSPESSESGWFPRFDPIIILTLLIAINAVYVAFVAIQFSYFFAAGDSVLPSGTSYAEYARRGFEELVIVTVINLSILLAVLRFIDRGQRVLYRIIQCLLTLLVAATGIILLSAHLRLALYEDAYGYTVTRILVHAFMFYLAVLFLAALYRIWRERLSLIKAYLAVSVVAYVAVNYMNVDAMVANSNIDRYERSGKLDAWYLGSLSEDAVPALAELYESPNKPKELAEVLRNKGEWLRSQQEGAAWSSWNVSKARAEKLLSQLNRQAEATSE